MYSSVGRADRTETFTCASCAMPRSSRWWNFSIVPMFSIFSRACGRDLARGHARSGDSRAIAAYLEKDERFDEAIGDFSVAYADQAERDHAALQRAVKLGKIDAYTE